MLLCQQTAWDPVMGVGSRWKEHEKAGVGCCLGVGVGWTFFCFKRKYDREMSFW